MKKLLSSIFKKKLHIFYRHVHIDQPNMKIRPHWFSFEACFKNLVSTIDQKNLPFEIDLTVMFDGNDASYERDYLSKFVSNYQRFEHHLKINVFKFKGGSDGKSFHTTLDFVLSKNYSDTEWIYFLENDYLHLPDWIEKLYSLIQSPIQFDYISLYDHKDKYQFSERFHEMHTNLRSKIYLTENHHWRTTPSTCASFLVNAKTFREDVELIRTGGMDHQFFDVLHENKSRVLLSPIPGLSTHVMTDLMSPLIDWKRVSEQAG